MTTPAPRQPQRVTIEVPAWVASLRDPGVSALLVLAGLAVIGFVMLGLAWRGAARTIYVPLQVPWLVSGAVAGLATLGFALAAWSIHLGRRQDAAHRAQAEELVRMAAELTDTIARRRGAVRPD